MASGVRHDLLRYPETASMIICWHGSVESRWRYESAGLIPDRRYGRAPSDVESPARARYGARRDGGRTYRSVSRREGTGRL